MPIWRRPFGTPASCEGRGLPEAAALGPTPASLSATVLSERMPPPKREAPPPTCAPLFQPMAQFCRHQWLPPLCPVREPGQYQLGWTEPCCPLKVIGQAFHEASQASLEILTGAPRRASRTHEIAVPVSQVRHGKHMDLRSRDPGSTEVLDRFWLASEAGICRFSKAKPRFL